MGKSGGAEFPEADCSDSGEELWVVCRVKTASGRCSEVEREADGVQFTIVGVKTVEDGDGKMMAGKSSMCRRLVFENWCAGASLVSRVVTCPKRTSGDSTRPVSKPQSLTYAIGHGRALLRVLCRGCGS